MKTEQQWDMFIRKAGSKCDSVVQDEGSRSWKAIVFIDSKSYIRLNAKAYSILRMALQRKTVVFHSNIEFRLEKALDVKLMKKISDKKWKK